MRGNKKHLLITKNLLTRESIRTIVAEIENGTILLVDKPQEWTSFDVVNKIRKTFQIKKAGHAGTLDPMATGLLIVCTSRMTKAIDEYSRLSKTYSGRMKLGEITSSYDSETDIVERRPYNHIQNEQLYTVSRQFVGTIQQVPPMYSALKKNGKPLYTFARKGIEIEREPRSVEIYNFQLTDISLPYIKFIVECSKGTYIRSLVHDFGLALDAGAHLVELRRTAIGEYSVEDALTIDSLMHLKNQIKEVQA